MFEFEKGTYEELYQSLQLMSDEDRKKNIQVLTLDSTNTLPIIGMGTVQEVADDEEVNSCYDGKKHLDDIVLMADHYPFAEDGAFAYDLETADPIYGKNERKFTSQELEFLFSLGFYVEGETLVGKFTLSSITIQIIKDGVLNLNIDNVFSNKNYQYKNFYKMIHHVLSVIEDTDDDHNFIALEL